MIPISHAAIPPSANERTGRREARSPAGPPTGRGRRRRFPARLIDLAIVSAVFLFLAAIMFGGF